MSTTTLSIRLAAIVSGAILALTLAGCQTAQSAAGDEPATRSDAGRISVPVPAPPGLDTRRPADRLEAMDLRQGYITRDDISRPADRLAGERGAGVSAAVPGCRQHIVLQGPQGRDRVLCLTAGR